MNEKNVKIVLAGLFIVGIILFALYPRYLANTACIKNKECIMEENCTFGEWLFSHSEKTCNDMEEVTNWG